MPLSQASALRIHLSLNSWKMAHPIFYFYFMATAVILPWVGATALNALFLFTRMKTMWLRVVCLCLCLPWQEACMLVLIKCAAVQIDSNAHTSFQHRTLLSGVCKHSPCLTPLSNSHVCIYYYYCWMCARHFTNRLHIVPFCLGFWPHLTVSVCLSIYKFSV